MSSTKVALIMGVANPRSIAWSCVERFARHGSWDIIFTCQSSKILTKVQPSLQAIDGVLGGFECDVLRDMEEHGGATEFQQRLAELLQDRPLSAVVHSLAYAPNIKTTPLLQSTREDFLMAQDISAYSLIQVARQTREFFPCRKNNSNFEGDATGSITALSYLGATRAIPGYNAMGPAKASLESIVRGLALEMADVEQSACRIRVNAVSAGPLPTISAKGGISGFDFMRKDMEEKAPLGNVKPDQVASTIQFLSSDAASGVTGQTVYVDGGYSIVGGPSMTKSSTTK